MNAPVEIRWGAPVKLSPAHHGEWRKAVVRDKELTPTARLVAIIIAEGICWGRTEKLRRLAGYTWRTQEQIAESIGKTDRQVRRCMDDLEKKGWIEIDQRAMGRTSLVRLVWPGRPSDRTPTSGQRKVRTRAGRNASGHFAPRSPDVGDRDDRTPMTDNHLENPIENHFEVPPRPEGVSAETHAAYVAARSSGDRKQMGSALRKLADELDEHRQTVDQVRKL